MSEFQKIAIGLLHLTSPEAFAATLRSSEESAPAAATPDAPTAADESQTSTERSAVSTRPVAGLVRVLKFALAALVAGSRTVPLGDNRQLVRDLARRASCLYGGPAE
jgi:hypothetical protein